MYTSSIDYSNLKTMILVESFNSFFPGINMISYINVNSYGKTLRSDHYVLTLVLIKNDPREGFLATFFG